MKRGIARFKRYIRTDVNTGEILDNQTEETYEYYNIKKKQHKFAMVMLDDGIESPYYQMKTWLDAKLIMYLQQYVNKTDDLLSVHVKLKQQAANDLGYSIKSIEKSITSLINANAITPIGRGIYHLNPALIPISGTVNLDRRIEKYEQIRYDYLNKKKSNTTPITEEQQCK